MCICLCKYMPCVGRYPWRTAEVTGSGDSHGSWVGNWVYLEGAASSLKYRSISPAPGRYFLNGFLKVWRDSALDQEELSKPANGLRHGRATISCLACQKPGAHEEGKSLTPSPAVHWGRVHRGVLLSRLLFLSFNIPTPALIPLLLALC